MGLLQRRLVSPLCTLPVGKEGNKVEEVEAGVIQDPAAVYTTYHQAWPTVQFALTRMPLATATRLSGLSPREVLRVRRGTVPRSIERRKEITRNAAAWAKETLLAAGRQEAEWLTSDEVLAAYQTQREAAEEESVECEIELEALREIHQADPHRHFKYWHDLTECWNRSTVKTGYHCATLARPMGVRTGTLKKRQIDGILNEAHDELGEGFSRFTAGVCEAIHGMRVVKLARLSQQAAYLASALAYGRLPPSADPVLAAPQ
ncbi:MAG: hypothetical protein ACYC4L_18295 [Chloroflexota bacterium]